MRKSVLVLFTVLSFTRAFAQDEFSELLKGSIKDVNTLMDGYVGPAMRGFGTGLNQGWYNTAKPHNTLGVDLTISTTLVYVPSSDEFYLVDNTKLDKIKLVSYDGKQVTATGSSNVPTVFGPDKAPTYQLTSSSEPFPPGPPGLDLKNTIKIANATPVPMIQLGIGLPKKIDLKVRFAPTVKLKDFQFNLWGIGVMHDIGQYLPAVKALPIDISAFVGYTNMKAEQDISTAAGGQNEKGVMEFKATTFQALVSKKLSFLTIYGGVGYNIAKSNFSVKGTYDLNNDGTPEAIDPVNLDFSTSGMRATGGLRLKFAVFTLHADYTLSQYNALNAGFGINVR